MDDMEKLELLKAVLAVAAADGEISRAEKGVIEGLADRVGVGSASLEAMLTAARRGDSLAYDVVFKTPEHSRTALELLVAEARIDGEISERERSLIVWIATKLGIKADAFERVYAAGLARADAVLNRHKRK
jgi:tellurite resistance protein